MFFNLWKDRHIISHYIVAFQVILEELAVLKNFYNILRRQNLKIKYGLPKELILHDFGESIIHQP